MTAFIYRLQTLLEQKEEAKKEAERELGLREQELTRQRAILEGLRRKVKELTEKRQNLQRQLMVKSDEMAALTANDVQLRIEFIKVVGLQIEEALSDAASQRTMVEECESRVEEGKQLVREANREVEVLQKHRSKQEDRFLKEQEKAEELALDEIGNVLYTTRRSAI
jgi:flagellar biosynthesis chaperone FliJ